MTCAKFHSDHFTTTWMRIEWNFHPVWIKMEKLLMKWAPGLVWCLVWQWYLPQVLLVCSRFALIMHWGWWGYVHFIVEIPGLLFQHGNQISFEDSLEAVTLIGTYQLLRSWMSNYISQAAITITITYLCPTTMLLASAHHICFLPISRESSLVNVKHDTCFFLVS